MFKATCIKLTSFILMLRLLPINLEYFGTGKKVNFSMQNIKYECFKFFASRNLFSPQKSLQSAARLGAVKLVYL